jgi:hypothetical protein
MRKEVSRIAANQETFLRSIALSLEAISKDDRNRLNMR